MSRARTPSLGSLAETTAVYASLTHYPQVHGPTVLTIASKMSSLYGSVECGSVEDHRAVRSRGRLIPLQHENPGHADDGLRSLKLQAKHGVGVAIVLGAMLLGFVVGSRVEVMRGSGAAGGAGDDSRLGQGEMLAEVRVCALLASRKHWKGHSSV